MRAGLGEDPAERRGRGLPRADAAGGLLGGEVGAARGHPGGGGGGGAASRRVERDWGDGGEGLAGLGDRGVVGVVVTV